MLSEAFSITLFKSVIFRLAGKIYSQTLENSLINGGENNGGMHLAAAQFRNLFHSFFSVFIGSCADRKRKKSFVRMDSGIIIAQMIYFEIHYRLDNVAETDLSYRQAIS